MNLAKKAHFFFSGEKKPKEQNYKKNMKQLDEEKKFCKKLYLSDHSTENESKVKDDINKFISDLPRQEELDIEDILLDLSGEDFKSVIDSCDAYKSPGDDGLPIEFYQHFWHVIKIHLLNAYKCMN